MLAEASPPRFEFRRIRPARSVWGTLIAAVLAGVAFAAGVLVQRPTKAAPPPQAPAPLPAQAPIGQDYSFGPTPTRTLEPVAVLSHVIRSAPVTPVASKLAAGQPHKHRTGHRSPTLPPPPPPSCSGRSTAPGANESGPVSSITHGLSQSLPAPLGGDGGVVTELSCTLASVGG